MVYGTHDRVFAVTNPMGGAEMLQEATLESRYEKKSGETLTVRLVGADDSYPPYLAIETDCDEATISPARKFVNLEELRNGTVFIVLNRSEKRTIVRITLVVSNERIACLVHELESVGNT